MWIVKEFILPLAQWGHNTALFQICSRLLMLEYGILYLELT